MARANPDIKQARESSSSFSSDTAESSDSARSRSMSRIESWMWSLEMRELAW